jgi:hypothetical protein
MMMTSTMRERTTIFSSANGELCIIYVKFKDDNRVPSGSTRVSDSRPEVSSMCKPTECPRVVSP